MGRTSALDAQEWVHKLRKKDILQFEYRELPEELKDMNLLRRAREEGYIIKVEKKGNGKIVWKLVDKINCRGIRIMDSYDQDFQCIEKGLNILKLK